MSDDPARSTAPRHVCRCEEIEEKGIRRGIFCVRPIAELLERHAGLPIPLGLLADMEE